LGDQRAVAGLVCFLGEGIEAEIGEERA